MNTPFRVGVSVELIDRVSSVLGGMSSRFKEAHKQAKELKEVLKGVGKNTALKEILDATRSIATGGMMVGAGVGLAASMKPAVEKAIELENVMKTVQLNLGGSNKELKEFQRMMVDVSNQTGFSQLEVGKMTAAMGEAGIRSLKDARALLPQFAAAADVLSETKHMSSETVMHSLSALAHQFGRFKPEEMKDIVETVTKLSLKLPGDLNSFVTMGGYINPKLARMHGVDPVKLLTLQAVAMQTAGSGSGGARGSLSGAALAAAMTRAIPGVFGSGLLDGKGALALEAMGFSKGGVSTLYKNGRYDMNLFLEKSANIMRNLEEKGGVKSVAKHMAEIAPQFLGKKDMATLYPWLKQVAAGSQSPSAAELAEKLTGWAFGQTGGRAVAAIGEKKFQEQLHVTEEYLKKQKSIAEMQKDLMSTTVNATRNLKAAWENVQIAFGQHLVPILNKTVKVAAEITKQVSEFLMDHPALTEMIAKGALLTSVLLTVGGTLLMVIGSLRIIEMILGQSMLSKLALLASRIHPITLIIGTLILVITNWKAVCEAFKIALDFARKALRVFLAVFPELKPATDAAGNAIMSLVAKLKGAAADLGEKIGAFRKQHHLEDKDILDHKAFMGLDGKNYSLGDIVRNIMNRVNAGQKEASKQFVPRSPIPPAGKLKASAAGVNIGSINIQQQPGEDGEALSKRIISKLNREAHMFMKTTTTAGGNFESPYLSGGIG